MSLILGTISALSLIYAIIFSYVKGGEISDRFGPALFVTLVMAVAGLILGAFARNEADKLRFIPTLGVILNSIAIITLGALLWVGLY